MRQVSCGLLNIHGGECAFRREDCRHLNRMGEAIRLAVDRFVRKLGNQGQRRRVALVFRQQARHVIDDFIGRSTTVDRTYFDLPAIESGEPGVLPSIPW